MDIKARREELGLTIQNVADFVGVSKSTISKWENGAIKNMRRDRIKKLSQILKVNPSDIIDSNEQETREPISDEDIMFALWQGDEGITDEMFEEVKQFAKMVQLREQHKKQNEDSD